MAKLQMQQIDKSDKEAILEALANYKKQNPAKYETKKAELFKRYSLTDDVKEVKDESDKELEALKEKVTKKKNAK